MHRDREYGVALRKENGTCRYWEHTNRDSARHHAVALVTRYGVDCTVHGRTFTVDASACPYGDKYKRAIENMHKRDAIKLIARFKEAQRSTENDNRKQE